MSGSYRDLTAWRKAMDMVVHVYQCTGAFPRDEMYGLTSQLRRAAVSVPSNIAEGKGRSTDKEFCLFLHHALGSLCEVETQLTIAMELGYIAEAEGGELMKEASETARVLNGLIKVIGKSIRTQLVSKLGR